MYVIWLYQINYMILIKKNIRNNKNHSSLVTASFVFFFFIKTKTIN